MHVGQLRRVIVFNCRGNGRLLKPCYRAIGTMLKCATNKEAWSACVQLWGEWAFTETFYRAIRIIVHCLTVLYLLIAPV